LPRRKLTGPFEEKYFGKKAPGGSLNRRRFSAKKLDQGMSENAPIEKLFPPGLELSLGHSESSKNKVPIRFQASCIFR
jgi:hypothetical protein